MFRRFGRGDGSQGCAASTCVDAARRGPWRVLSPILFRPSSAPKALVTSTRVAPAPGSPTRQPRWGGLGGQKTIGATRSRLGWRRQRKSSYRMGHNSRVRPPTAPDSHALARSFRVGRLVGHAERRGAGRATAHDPHLAATGGCGRAARRRYGLALRANPMALLRASSALPASMSRLPIRCVLPQSGTKRVSIFRISCRSRRTHPIRCPPNR